MASYKDTDDVSAVVKVQVVVEVTRHGYDGTHAFGFVEKQASKEALEAVRAALGHNDSTMKVIGEQGVAVTLTRRNSQ